MSTFYAQYPATGVSTVTVQTVQGEGTPGVQTGGVLTVQGDPSGTPIPVSGIVTATNPSVGATGNAVPADATYAGMNVGGNLTGLTGTANGLKVDGSAVTQPTAFVDSTATGNISSTQSVSISTIGYASVGVQVTGTWTGTLFTEWSPDNVTWYNTTWASIQTGALALTFAANGAGTMQCSGAAAVRVRGSSVASGTAVVYLRANSTSSQFMLDNPIPAGTNTIGNVGLTAGTNIIGKVSIDQTTPGTTNGVQVNAPLPAGSNTIGAVTQASGPWTVTGSGTAGTAATGVVTIQGIASMTPVKVDPSGGTGSVNVAQFGGSNVVTGTGTSGAGIPRVTVSSDSSLASVTTVSTVTAVTAITNALPAGTNLLGKVGIDQTTPGTTNAIQATSGTTATWQAEGNLAFGSITSAFQTVFTPAANTKILYMRNNTNASISVSMDAGTTTNFILDAGDQVSTDFVANGLKSPTTAIQIKQTSGAPTSGSFRVNGAS